MSSPSIFPPPPLRRTAGDDDRRPSPPPPPLPSPPPVSPDPAHSRSLAVAAATTTTAQRCAGPIRGLSHVPMADEPPLLPEGIQIREVWADNLDEEMALIRDIVDRYPFVAMDTEFPGIVCRPVGNFRTTSDFNYAILKENVNMLKLIQLGLTFADEDGNLPDCGTGCRGCVWQFNFREFDPQKDPSASDSIELLRDSGIDFPRNVAQGVDARRFAELIMSSGVVLNSDVHWVTFHSGYDFGYLLKVLMGKNLPDTPADFFELINKFFPILYDIKHLMKFCGSLYGGLNKLAELLDVKRVGVCHQAGSDSLLTLCTFRKLKESFLKGSTEKYAGVLYGLEVDNAQILI